MSSVDHDSPRTALVTGGSRGIGRAIVELLADEGWQVAFTYRSREDAAREVEQRLGRDRCLALRFDLADRVGVRTLVEEVEERLGPLHGLVNNAGVSHAKLLAMTSDEEWDSVIESNLGGAFRLCRAALPGMVRRRHGSIVNVSSLGAVRGVAGQSVYAASKAGLLGLSRSLAREMGKRNIRVNVVIPGFVATDMTGGLPEAAVKALRGNEALPGGADASAVAEAVAFLLSERARATTGQTLYVDAGASA